jgi:hypothetical protein
MTERGVSLGLFILAVGALVGLVSADSLFVKVLLAAIAVVFIGGFTVFHAPNNEPR